MEQLKVRKLSQKTIAGLDDLARKNGQSREEYARRLLNHHVESVKVQGVRSEYEELVKMCLAVIESNTKSFEEFNRINRGE